MSMNGEEKAVLRRLIAKNPTYAVEQAVHAMQAQVEEANTRAAEYRNAVTSAIGLRASRLPKDCPTRQALEQQVVAAISGDPYICEADKKFLKEHT